MNAMGRRERVEAAPTSPVAKVVPPPIVKAPPAPRLTTVPGVRCRITGCTRDAAVSDRRTAEEFTSLCLSHKREATRLRDGVGMSARAAVEEIEARLATVGKPCPTRGCTGSAGRYARKLAVAFRALCFGCRNRACVTRTRRPELSPTAIVEAMRAGGAA